MSIVMVWIHCSACGKQTTGDVSFVGKDTTCCGKGVWLLGKRDAEVLQP